MHTRHYEGGPMGIKQAFLKSSTDMSASEVVTEIPNWITELG
jgi:hypothetical protein